MNAAVMYTAAMYAAARPVERGARRVYFFRPTNGARGALARVFALVACPFSRPFGRGA